MKKLFIAFTAVFAAFVISLSAEAATEVFDLHIENGEISDAVGGTAIEKGGDAEIGYISSVIGDTPYIKFAEKNSNTDAYLYADESFDENLKEMSVEVWANAQIKSVRGSGRMFAFGERGGASSSEVRLYSNKLYYKAGATVSGKDIEKSSASLAEYSGQWAHYVFTRKRNAGNTEYAVYVNGVKQSELCGEAEACAIENGGFFIGNGCSGTDGFRGSIGKIRVYSGIISEAEAMEKYSSEVDLYSEAGDTLELKKITPDGSLDAGGGKIRLEFNNILDKASAQEAVSLKSSDGKADSALIVEAVSNKLDITYGLIEPGEYTLEISGALCSTNGIYFTPQSFSFTAEQKMIVNDDFEDGVMPDGYSVSGGGKIQVKEECGTGGSFGLNFSGAVDPENHYAAKSVRFESRDGFTAEFDLNTALKYETRFYLLTPGGDAFIYCMSAGDGNLYYGDGNLGSNWSTLGKGLLNPETYYHIKLEFFPKANTENAFDYNIYIDGVKYGGYTVTGVKDNSVVNGFKIYCKYNDQTGSGEVSYDNIKLYSISAPDILKINAENGGGEDGYIDIVFNSDVDPQSLNEENIILSCNGEVIDWTLSGYSSEIRTASVFPLQYLPQGAVCTVKYKNIAGVLSAAMVNEKELSFTVGEQIIDVRSCTFRGGSSAGGAQGEMGARLSFKNAGLQGQRIFAVLCVFDSSGRLVGAADKTAELSASEQKTIELEALKSENGISAAQVYVWNISGGKMVPVLNDALKYNGR